MDGVIEARQYLVECHAALRYTSSLCANGVGSPHNRA